MSVLHPARTDRLLPVHDLFFPQLSPHSASKPSSLFDKPDRPQRPALSRVNTNTSRKSIPKPVSTPDVFNTERTKPKRSIENGTTGTSKRARLDAKAEEESWRARWIKQFPGLTFHFEIGAEDKVMESRVKLMGARVDQFFSARVTHLVVKSTSRPMAPPPRKSAVRESPKNPFLDGTGVTDLAQKAEAMGIKVWTMDKLFTILTRLAPPTEATKDSLHTLLEDERIHGTKERDLSAPRPDYYYFKPGSKYLLIEDATGRHRTVMVKEYLFKDQPEWPTLYERFLRPSANVPQVDVSQVRDRAWSLYVDQKPFQGEDLPRRLSTVTPKLPDAVPYQNASGNSVVLTSNIASTSTANHSPAIMGPMALYKDRTLMQMNKRVQVLKGNARLAAAKKEPATEPPARKTFLTRQQLVAMLDQARQPVKEDISVEMRIKNREEVDAGIKGREQETAAGYCENCRIRYNDLSLHVASKKHRKFAADDENFESLDNLLTMLGRAPNPILSVSQIPPCDQNHYRDAHCECCDMGRRHMTCTL